MQMLKEGTAWSILKHHHPGEGLIACAVTEQIHEVLVVHSGQQ
jgi:hypothetical protein